jgi:chromosome segregation protein
MNHTCRERFKSAFDEVNKSLADIFPVLFEGASAELVISGSEDVLDAGVEFLVHLPGKKIRHLNLLSGGEKAMAALALIFAIYFIKPSPFCLLDEVDAPLDEANTTRFNRLIKKISEYSQVVLITHNQRVMEVADTLYGITMEKKGVSKLVSVELAGG